MNFKLFCGDFYLDNFQFNRDKLFTSNNHFNNLGSADREQFAVASQIAHLINSSRSCSNRSKFNSRTSSTSVVCETLKELTDELRILHTSMATLSSENIHGKRQFSRKIRKNLSTSAVEL